MKVFPCGQVGGAKYIKALKGPLPGIPLVPTGGVNMSTAAEFLEAGAAALGIGGELVHPDHLKSGNAELIVENARRFLAIVAQTRAKMGFAATVPAASFPLTKWWETGQGKKYGSGAWTRIHVITSSKGWCPTN